MKIVNALPPMYEEILAAFPFASRPGVIFCWGDSIYAPLPLGTIGPELLAHESIHSARQGNDPGVWWRRYIALKQFRLIEEFPAHVAEFNVLCELHRHKWPDPRAMRRVFAGRVAAKLAAPLYGDMISVKDAKAMILESRLLSHDDLVQLGTVDAAA